MDVGGQAVIEGVMRRNREKYAVAVRLPSGKIKVKKEQSSTFPKFFNVFFIRGVVGLGYTMYDGIRALIWSSNENLRKDVKTLFQYHGAEHKTIYCYENKKELTVENVRRFSRFHPRCGTSFLFVVLLLSIFVFTLLSGPWWVKFLGRIALLPVIAGLGYEILKLSSKYAQNIIVRFFIAPGLWMQRITTKEPTDAQIEIGIHSLKAVVE